MAAGRISLRLTRTSCPPWGRGSTAGQTLALPSSGWGQPGLGPRLGRGSLCSPLLLTWCLCRHKAGAVPSLPLASPGELQHPGGTCAAHGHHAIVSNGGTGAVWEGTGGSCWHHVGAGMPQIFGTGHASHVLCKGPVSSIVLKASGPGGRGAWGSRWCQGHGQSQAWARLGTWSSLVRELPSGEKCLQTGDLQPARVCTDVLQIHSGSSIQTGPGAAMVLCSHQQGCSGHAEEQPIRRCSPSSAAASGSDPTAG